MKNYTAFSAYASLAVIGLRMRQMKIWKTIEEHVQIHQKTIRHTPLEKLLDAFINILTGGRGLVEINTRLRPDGLLQRAFGRTCCAEQSTVSQTLNRCTDETVVQMREALTQIYRRRGQGFGHRYQKQMHLLDVDMTGLPAGRQGEGVTKGYFAGQRKRRGRQLGRVLATLYEEIIVERLYRGTVQLEQSFQALVEAAEQVLALSPEQRRGVVLRVDGGAGRDADINWALERGYHLMVKVKNWKRTHKLLGSVRIWYQDPHCAHRQIGWVEAPHRYVKPTRQVATRQRKDDGKYVERVLVFTLSDAELFEQARQPYRKQASPQQVLLAAVNAYDLRGGGVETSIKGSKQGLGLNKRNKRCFAAQEMLVLLAQLANNMMVWLRRLLERDRPEFRHWGMLRLVRDLCRISGKMKLDSRGRIVGIKLNKAHPLAEAVTEAFAPVLARDGVSLNLGKT